MGSFAADQSPAQTSSYIDDIKVLVTTSPRFALENWGEAGIAEMSWYRRNPKALFITQSNPIQHTEKQLVAAFDAYRLGEVDKAYELSLDGYLEGFELIETILSTRDEVLTVEIAREMLTLRSDMASGLDVVEVEAKINTLREKLQIAQRLLDGDSLSFVTAFTSAFIILLREGLEAMLVVLALVTFVKRSDVPGGVVQIHLGWISALLAGVATWWISTSFIQISGASRELTEGIAALSASAILLYVGFWMHSKSNADGWRNYIETHANRVISSGALWGMSGLAFIAVYREVFETILFYQALWLQVSGPSKYAIIYGFTIGCLALVGGGYGIIRYVKKLPVSQFFAASAILMFVLAFILAGKGMIALQEAGVIVPHPVTFINIDFLGIHPYLESLSVQFGILLIGLGYWLKARSSVKEQT